MTSNIPGIPVFKSEWYLFSPTGYLRMTNIDSPTNSRCVQYGTSLPATDVEGANFLFVVEIQMFMMPTLVTMTIAATRMYRFLAEFCSYTDVYVIHPFQ